jgi:hypothetical protein
MTLTPLTKNEDIPRAAITYYPVITTRLQHIFKKHNKGKISDIVGNSKENKVFTKSSVKETTKPQTFSQIW